MRGYCIKKRGKVDFSLGDFCDFCIVYLIYQFVICSIAMYRRQKFANLRSRSQKRIVYVLLQKMLYSLLTALLLSILLAFLYQEWIFLILALVCLGLMMVFWALRVYRRRELARYSLSSDYRPSLLRISSTMSSSSSIISDIIYGSSVDLVMRGSMESVEIQKVAR